MHGRLVAAGLACALTCFAIITMPSRANAAELKLFAGSSMRTLLPGLLPQFEKSSGEKVVPEYGTLGANADHVMKGEGDVAIVTDAQNEKLEKEGKLLAGSQAELAKVGYGVLVKATAPKPAIGTVDAFKRTLLSAKSVCEGDPSGGGPVGVYTAGLLQRLGIADELKPKTKLYKSGTQVAEAVAKGECEFGIGLASDAVVVPGLAAIPLPAEIQRYTHYTLGVVANSRSPDAAKALVAFLTSPTVKQTLAAHGFEVQ